MKELDNLRKVKSIVLLLLSTVCVHACVRACVRVVWCV